MTRHLITVALAACTMSAAGCATDTYGDRYGDRYSDSRYSGRCYPGERRNDCRERLRYEQQTNQRYVWRDGRYEREDSSNVAGAAVAAGIIGFILGAAIAGSDDDRKYYDRHRNDRDWQRRCAAAHPGFDARTGTYLGPDGLRRYCTR